MLSRGLSAQERALIGGLVRHIATGGEISLSGLEVKVGKLKQVVVVELLSVMKSCNRSQHLWKWLLS